MEHLETLGYFTEEEVARIRNITIGTLRNQRVRNEGPPFCRVGNRILYSVADLKRYIESAKVETAPPSTLISGRRSRNRVRRGGVE